MCHYALTYRSAPKFHSLVYCNACKLAPHVIFQSFITRYTLGHSHFCPETRAACAEAASALAAIARPGAPTLFRGQFVEGSGGDGLGGGGQGVHAQVEFGGGDRADEGDDSLHKRPRDGVDVEAAAPARSHRPSAPKLAEASAHAAVAEEFVRGGDVVDAGRDASDDDSGNSEDIPDVVFESADEGD